MSNGESGDGKQVIGGTKRHVEARDHYCSYTPLVRGLRLENYSQVYSTIQIMTLSHKLTPAEIPFLALNFEVQGTAGERELINLNKSHYTCCDFLISS